MSNLDDVAIAQFAAQISGELIKVDQNTINGSRTNPAAKLDPYSFLRKGQQPNQQNLNILAPKVVVPDGTDPNLAPLPLEELLIPLPDDLKNKVNKPTEQPPPIPTKQGLVQLELPLTLSPNDSNIPQSPREMFDYFKERLDMIDSKITGVIALIREIKEDGVPRKNKKWEGGPK